MTFRGTPTGNDLPEKLLSEFGDLHGAAIGEHGADFQVGAEGLEIASEAADAYVGPVGAGSLETSTPLPDQPSKR